MMTRALPMIPTTAMMPKVTGTTTEARTGRMLKDVGSKPGHKQGVINITHISFLKHAELLINPASMFALRIREKVFKRRC